MRHWPVLLLSLLLAGCSCQRRPAAETVRPAAAVASPAQASSQDDGLANAEARANALADAQAFSAAASTIHGYIPALMDADRRKSDAFWSGGRAPPHPDDAVLRSLADVQALRVENDAGTALDDRHPPSAVEIPVRLTARSGSGVQRIHGWYRLRPRIDGHGWEITSASLQPVLD